MRRGETRIINPKGKETIRQDETPSPKGRGRFQLYRHFADAPLRFVKVAVCPVEPISTYRTKDIDVHGIF